MWECPHCHTINAAGKRYCQNCGKKRPAPQLVIECPNCGQVSPIGTQTCPNCHRPLPQNDVKKLFNTTPITSRRLPTRVLRYLAGLLVIIFAAWMAYNISANFSARNNSPFVVVRFDYYSASHHRLYADYYVAHQTVSPHRQRRFQLAYVGQNAAGVNRLRNNDIANISYQFQHRPHYQFRVTNRSTILTGPRKVSIKATAREVHDKYQNDTSKFTNFRGRNLKCRVKGDPTVHSVKIKIPMASVNDS